MKLFKCPRCVRTSIRFETICEHAKKRHGVEIGLQDNDDLK